ncbi:hypothetical protein V8C42DRAFT_210959 [Trichoderma barbatum]
MGPSVVWIWSPWLTCSLDPCRLYARGGALGANLACFFPTRPSIGHETGYKQYYCKGRIAVFISGPRCTDAPSSFHHHILLVCYQTNISW